MLDELDELGGGQPAEAGGALPPGRQPRAHDLGEVDAVVADGGDVFRDAEPGLRDGVEAADEGEVVGEEDAGRSLRQREQLLRGLVAARRIVSGIPSSA